jgi:hypothetical protein
MILMPEVGNAFGGMVGPNTDIGVDMNGLSTVVLFTSPIPPGPVPAQADLHEATYGGYVPGAVASSPVTDRSIPGVLSQEGRLLNDVSFAGPAAGSVTVYGWGVRFGSMNGSPDHYGFAQSFPFPLTLDRPGASITIHGPFVSWCGKHYCAGVDYVP